MVAHCDGLKFKLSYGFYHSVTRQPLAPSPIWCIVPTMNPLVPDEALQAIREALRQSDKIQAIKLYREVHPVGLAEAKEAVEALEPKLFVTTPGFCSVQRSRKLTRFLTLWIFPLLALSSFCFGMDFMTRASKGEHISRAAQWWPWISAICFSLAAIVEYRQQTRLKKT
jgi:hypothetical protein